MTTWTRYLLIQLPGWVLAVIVLLGLLKWSDLPEWAAAVLFLAYVVKDFAIYPFVRRAYESTVDAGLGAMIGETGVAKELLNPRGYIRVRGELWFAEALPREKPILAESKVRVNSVEGNLLIVELEGKS